MNTGVSLLTRLWWLGYLGFLHYLSPWIPAMEYFGLFFLMFLLSGVAFIWSIVRARRDDPSLPIERVAGFAVGMLLSMFNPVTWLYSLLQVQDHPNFFLPASIPVMFDGQFVHGGQRLTGLVAGA